MNVNLKSTSVIETESENLNKITIEIEKSGVKNQDKSKLLDFVSQTKNTIPLLTNEQLLNNDTREQIKLINEKIINLTENFKRSDYPNESAEQELKELKLLRKKVLGKHQVPQLKIQSKFPLFQKQSEV
jgi:taurine transport system permease protein